MKILQKSNLSVHLALLGVACLYGANYNIAKLVTPAFISPFALVILRVVLATLLFWIAGLFIRTTPIPKKMILQLAVCAAFGTAGTQ
ncbi:MAG: EamA/RhaT family transporter, partial [Bacteroidota bacterium]